MPDNQITQHSDVEDAYSPFDVAMMYLTHTYGIETIVTWLHDNCYEDTLNMMNLLNMCGEHEDC